MKVTVSCVRRCVKQVSQHQQEIFPTVQVQSICHKYFINNSEQTFSTMPSIKFLLLACIICLTEVAAFAPSTHKPAFARSQMNTQRYNIIDAASSFFANFGKKARASHILIGPKDWDSEEQAREKLVSLKEEIDNDPDKFAQAAAVISSCPSGKKGGDLGEFSPGMMVRDFDKVCFYEEVGVVHGPIKTQFGEHLILITERTGEK